MSKPKVIVTITHGIPRGASVDSRDDRRGQTALMWAAAENNAGAVRLLVESGADVRMRTKSGAFTALLFAVRAGHLDATRALLDLRDCAGRLEQRARVLRDPGPQGLFVDHADTLANVWALRAFSVPFPKCGPDRNSLQRL